MVGELESTETAEGENVSVVGGNRSSGAKERKRRSV
jgi:hypothetical protein